MAGNQRRQHNGHLVDLPPDHHHCRGDTVCEQVRPCCRGSSRDTFRRCRVEELGWVPHVFFRPRAGEVPMFLTLKKKLIPFFCGKYSSRLIVW